MKLLILGYSGSGKTTAAQALAEILGCGYANTSDRLIEDYATEHGLDVQSVKLNKAKLRNELFDFGRAKQAKDALYPQSEQLKRYSILTGLRNPNEIEAAREHSLYDLIIWIKNDRCSKDATDRLIEDDADVIVPNNGSIEELKQRLHRLIRLPELQ